MRDKPGALARQDGSRRLRVDRRQAARARDGGTVADAATKNGSVCHTESPAVQIRPKGASVRAQ
jgi:hypothetical protein